MDSPFLPRPRPGLWHHVLVNDLAQFRSCESSATSPWAAWNLRFNPFGEPPFEDVPGLIVEDLADLQAWVERPAHALQLLGEQGRGKTARLRALEPQLGFPYIYLAEGEPIPPLPRRGGLLLDEAQRLPKRDRRTLFGTIDQLVLSSHLDLESDLAMDGWTVRTIEVGGLDLARLDAILDRRIEWARRNVGPVPCVKEKAQLELMLRHGDNLRAILDDLYEDFQQAATGGCYQEECNGEV